MCRRVGNLQDAFKDFHITPIYILVYKFQYFLLVFSNYTGIYEQLLSRRNARGQKSRYN